MSDNSLKLDPWAASSLLQKAIRRGEVELAQAAARCFYRHRGTGIWRRLSTIAVEDIGIADTGLLQEVARVATDKELRGVLGSDAQLIDDLCSRMAEATKDRSADYLYCAATKLDTAAAERSELAALPVSELIATASDDALPLTRRAVATLLACTTQGKSDSILLPDRVQQYLDALPVNLAPVQDAVSRLARARAHPFCVLLPIIWARWWHFGAQFAVAEGQLPNAQTVAGIPLYTWDKHTAAGKQAIAKFARENAAVASALSRWVPAGRNIDVAAIAAFYGDAAPVARRLNWPTGALLERTGSCADMMYAGCQLEGVEEVLECVRENLPHLNLLRRAETRQIAARAR